MTKKPLLFRMDSSNDALENMLLLHWRDPQLKFLIKHNFRREDRYALVEKLKSVCQNVKHPRDGKTVYIGSTWWDFETEKDGKFTIRMVYEITEITTSADGQEMLFPETEIDMYWTSLGVSDEEVIELYHNHAVCEQYHSKIKTDMGIDRLPSGKIDTNALILKLTIIAYNILCKTVTEAGGSWGQGCLEGSSIEALTIESGMKTTLEYLAAECTTRRTDLPDSVSEIGDYSFAGCKNLEKVKSNRNTFNFSAHSFEGCVKLDDSRFTVLDLENTYLSANSEQANVNSIINYTLKYKLMPSVAAGADNLEIHINMPEGLTLLLDSVQSKNLSFDPEDIEDGVISVNSTEGELRFTARVTEVGDYEVSATLNFDYNNSWWE